MTFNLVLETKIITVQFFFMNTFKLLSLKPKFCYLSILIRTRLFIKESSEWYRFNDNLRGV